MTPNDHSLKESEEQLLKLRKALKQALRRESKVRVQLQIAELYDDRPQVAELQPLMATAKQKTEDAEAQLTQAVAQHQSLRMDQLQQRLKQAEAEAEQRRATRDKEQLDAQMDRAFSDIPTAG
jgi:carbamate kinase